MEIFYNRFEERKKLCRNDNNTFIKKMLIFGESGMGKSTLVKEIYNDKYCFWCDGLSNNYFRSFVLNIVENGFHNYLMSQNKFNYKDLYLAEFQDRSLQNNSLVNFLFSKRFFSEKKEVSLEMLSVKFLLDHSKCKTIIFDNFQNCDYDDYGRIMNMLQTISKDWADRSLQVIFIISEASGKKFDLLNSLCDNVLMLSGLEKRYIKALVTDFFGNPAFNCDEISEYLFEKYNGNPGLIINLLKLKFNKNSSNCLSKNDILFKLTSTEYINLDTTEKRIVLFLSVLPYPISTKKMTRFISQDKDFPNIDSFETIIDKIHNLACRGILQLKDDILKIDSASRILYISIFSSDIIYVYMIHTLLKNFDKVLSSHEKADCLYFIMCSKKIEFTNSMIKKIFNFSIETSITMANNRMWTESICYFKRIICFTDLLTEKIITRFYECIYYSAKFAEFKDFVEAINDNEFLSFEYWYWKGNILYMLNSNSSIKALDNAIIAATYKGDRVKAQIIREEAMSELPLFCQGTFDYYNCLLTEYENADFPELALLYRNSLVVGGYQTVALCNKGLEIAEKYNLMEETVKLKHNQNFELFRMGKYDSCFTAFEESARFFQGYNDRKYESAYGYNNLSLVCLLNQQYSDAKLYSYSAVIYADTPYSQIATHVNYNLIMSFCENNSFELEKRVSKIEELFDYYRITDHRMYRKAYMSIAISYINVDKYDVAKEYLLKARKYLQTGRHINRYINLCQRLNITFDTTVSEVIDENNCYYNFYSNPQFELWLLAFGHL